MHQTDVDLGHDVIFTYYGPQIEPQTGRSIYYGTVGASPEFNSRAIERLMAELPEGIASDVSTLQCLSSEWELIEFSNHCRDWVIESLRSVVASTA